MWNLLLLSIATHFIVTQINCVGSHAIGIDQQDVAYESNRKFAIVVDAGSTGSRMFVFTWRSTNDGLADLSYLQFLHDNETKPITKKVTPGLSSFSDNPSDVRSYVYDLLDVAAKEIPSVYHETTSVYIFATAGMRLLTTSTQMKIYNEVRDAVRGKYKFKFENENARTITGEEEALFGWIAINFMLDSFPIKHDEKKTTHGMLDMGGASMQIAFEVSTNQPALQNAVTSFDFLLSRIGNRVTYKIYGASHLNYGMKQFRQMYEYDLITKYLESMPGMQVNESTEITDPCLNEEFNYTTTIRLMPSTSSTEDNSNVTVTLKGKGDFDKCFANIIPLLKIEKNCDPLVCGINGTKQPRIDFADMEFYGLTEFYYSLQDALPDDSSNYEYNKVVPKIKEICALTWRQYLEWLRKKANVTSEKDYVCFKPAYVLAALHVGFSFPKDYKQFHPVSKLGKTEVQWALGALLYILNSEVQYAINRKIIIIVAILVILIVLGLCIFGFFMFRRRRNQASQRADVESISMPTKQSNNQTSAIMVSESNSNPGPAPAES